MPHPWEPALARVWQEGHVELQSYETACALYKYLKPSTVSLFQHIRKGAVSALVYSKETCLWAGRKETVSPSGAAGALWSRFLQGSTSCVLTSGFLLLPYLLAQVD